MQKLQWMNLSESTKIGPKDLVRRRAFLRRPCPYKNKTVFKQIETGVLGFQVMIVTVVKAFLEKQKPEIFLYMNPKYFCRFNFENELFQEQNKGYTIISNLEFFNQSVLSVLNKDARY